MSLVVQVASGPGGSAAPPPAPPKGVVITATARGPPPAHSATPFSFQDQHVVQHHPQPAGPPGTPPGYSRPLPMSPASNSRPLPMSPASNSRPLPMSPGRPHGARTRITDSSHRLVVQHHQLPTQPLPLLSPGPGHASILGTSERGSLLANERPRDQPIRGHILNNPLIPQTLPTSFMPRLPIHLTQPAGVRLSPAPPHHHHHHHHHHRSPLHVSGHQLSSTPAAPDSNILPPHAIRRLTRPAPSIRHPDDDIEVGESPVHPPPQHHRHRSLMSPKHNRKGMITNLALQDHNYVAAPPPSPPRSPTPPISPYTSAPNMGVALQSHGKDGLAPGLDSGVSGVPGSLVPGLPAPAVSPSVGGYPSPHYTGGPLPSPRNRLKESLDAAGVGPMTPLGDSDSLKDRSVSDATMEDGGEETETAPEAEDEGQDDSITRCICDYQHDDGYMICCDKCSVWQHVICMGLDKNNIPDEYLCEKCSPRPVDRKRAKALQKAIAKEQKERFAKLRQQGLAQDSSDEEKSKAGLAGLDKSRKPFTTLGRKFPGKKNLEKKLLEGKKLLKKPHKRRQHRDPGGKVNTESSSPGSPTKRSGKDGGSPRKSSGVQNRLSRRSLSDAETEADESQGETLSLRSWIDNYEEAVTNHYSPELRARLSGAKMPSNFFKPKDVTGIRCNVSLRGNGLKVLTSNSHIPVDTAVIECRGKYMLNNPGLNKASKNNPYVLQHRLNPELEVLVDGTTYGNDSRFCRRASPSTGESNAVIKHHLEKGSLHLYIVASKNIEKNSEILLPPLQRKNGHIETEEMSIADELREIKKASSAASGKLVNGSGSVEAGGRRKLLNKKRVVKREASKKKDEVSSSDEDEDVRAEREARIAKEKERLARQREQREREREEKGEKSSPRKTRSAVNSGSVVTDVKEEEEEVKEEPVIKKEAEFKEEKQQLSIMIPREREGSVQNSPSITSPALGKSPTKPSLGLPDQSGLIVGVNTINYDVSFRNKTKTREERKMEMIMKAFEDMEKSAARRRAEGEPGASVTKPEKKRRRSNSIKAGGNSGAGGDSNLDQSSADEGYEASVAAALSNAKKKGRSANKRPGMSAGSVAGGRRKSRAKSGDSSALSEPETADENPGEKFKFPGRVSEDHDDDVSRQYIRGSRSPPGIANHLLRSARTDRSKEAGRRQQTETSEVNSAAEKQSPVPESSSSSSSKAALGCSAKKRWLMAAMSVDMTENDEGSGASPAAPASPELPDYTPLKKRRLAEYTNDSSEVREFTNDSSEDVIASIAGASASAVSDKIKSLPNGLKKRLISNLVLEAVLDKAMEDYTPGNYNDENLDSNTEDTMSANQSPVSRARDVSGPIREAEDTSSPFINDTGEEEAEAMEVMVTKPRSFRDKRKEAILQAELEARSNNSSESEEASTNERPVARSRDVSGPMRGEEVRESFVPVKRARLEETNEESRDHSQPISIEEPASPNPCSVPVTTNQRPESLLTNERMQPIRGQEEEEGSDVPETASSTPLQDENTADSAVSVPSQHTVFKSFFSTDLSVEDIDRQLEARREALAKEALASGGASPLSLTDLGPSSSQPPTSAAASSSASESASASSVKKRMSLADYKKRKLSQVDSVGSSSGSQPATPTATPSATPLSGLTLPPLTLPSLPSLSLGQEAQETRHDNRERSRHSSHRSSLSRPGSRSPSSQPPPSETGNRIPPQPEVAPEPREDLTERLRKEFGLNIDEDEEEADLEISEAVKVNNVVKEVVKDSKEVKRRHEKHDHPKSSSKSSDYSRSSKHSSEANERPGSRSRDQSGPMRGQEVTSESQSRSRDGGYSDKAYSKYHDKRSDYRDNLSTNERPGSRSRESSAGYRDKGREPMRGQEVTSLSTNERPGSRSRHHEKSRHGGRRPSHPSSPSGGPGGHGGHHRGSSMTNGGRRGHHGSPARRSSQDKDSRGHSSSSTGNRIISSSSSKNIREKIHSEEKYGEKYYKSDSASSRRNFYPQ